MKRTCLALLSLVALPGRAQTAAPAAAPLGAYAQGLQAPARVAADRLGNVFVAEPQAGRVVLFDAFGQASGIWSPCAQPLAIAVDAHDQLYLADAQTGSVSVFDPQRHFLYQLGSGAGEFQLPNHIAPDPANPGTVYVADSKANLVKVYTGAALVNQFGGAGSGNGQFDFPAGLCISAAGEVFVVDQNNDRVEVFDRTGTFRRLFSVGGTTSSPSGRSQGAVVDNAGRLYVADAFQGVVKVFDGNSGAALSNLGGFGQLPGQLNSPAGLALDPFNRLFVTSANNRRLESYGLDSFVQLAAQPAGRVLAAGAKLVLSAATGGAGLSSWQWLKNGAAIAGATNSTLTLGSVGPSDGGVYSLVMTGSFGALTSGVTQVTVLTAPAIVSGPPSLTVFRGTDVTLQVSASGSALGYQWQLNGINIDGATNSILALSGVDTFQAGSYSVAVSNPLGVVASAPALLSVVVPPTVMEILSGAAGPDQLFHLTINADPGINWAVDATTDFNSWQTLSTNLNQNGLFDFADLDSTNVSQRNYRLRWVP